MSHPILLDKQAVLYRHAYNRTVRRECLKLAGLIVAETAIGLFLWWIT